MASLIYAPGIKVLIETVNGTLDISDDLVGGTLILRENAPHTFQFQLQNAQRKYDARLLPMDKISVQLKRLNWVQVMTGYLNDSPIFQAWPGVLNISATCTLKVPQFYYTDTTTAAFQSMVRTALGATSDQRAVQGDSGLTRLIVDSMSQVMHWDKGRIHIGQIPKNWFNFAQQVATLVGKDEALYKTLGPGYTSAGSYNGAAVIQPSTYSGFQIGSVQAKNLSTVVSTALSTKTIKTTPQNLAVMAVMCVLVESSGGFMYANSKLPESLKLPHDRVGSNGFSVGLYQQQPTEGWGTVAHCMDAAASTQTFLKRLLTVLPKKTPNEVNFGSYVQAVQRSGNPNAYQVQLNVAKAIVASAQALNSSDPTINGQSISPPTSGFKCTGSQIARVALDLIESHNTSRIHYQEGGDDSYTTARDKVKKLDCSSLVDWVYYHSVGNAFSQPRSIVSTYNDGCKHIPLAAAKNIQGAVLINPPDNHIAISTGDGHCVAAKWSINNSGNAVPLDQQVISGDPIDGQGFAYGGLLPKVDYSISGTSEAAMKALTKAGVKVRGKAQPLTNATDPTEASGVGADGANDPIQNLINNIITNSSDASSLIGEAFGGAAVLINDQPFLPWLQTVINASMRSFCSGPNGDFIAWFPDYFNAWNSAAIMNVELIELQDFQITWSDQQIVTHQFAIGNVGGTLLDPTSGAVSSNGAITDLLNLSKGTAGIATMDYPEIFKVIYGETVSTSWTHAFLARFGARPDVVQMPNIPHGQAEFFMALYLFMQRWAAQFTASIDLTFMPELYPGMLLRLPAYGFQAYVQGVTHTFQFGDNGSFTTTVDVCAPSNIGGADRTDLMELLPMAQSAPQSTSSTKLKTKH